MTLPTPPRCTRRRYRTARYARRQAYSQQPDPALRTVAEQCQDENCGGAWHLAAPTGDTQSPDQHEHPRS